MRCPLFVFLAALLACRSTPSSSSSTTSHEDAATGPFEGEIEMSVGALRVVSKLKGNKSHFVFTRANGMPMSELYVDGDAQKVYSPMRGHKYAELSLEAAAPAKPLVAKNTGEKDTVLGHECEILSVVDQQTRVEICLATDLPPLLINVGPTSNGPGFQPAFGKGFPLRIRAVSITGTATVEAKRIERKTVPDSEVEPHADWQKVPVSADGGAKTE